MSDEEKKIIIDEDWKAQVEAEKQAAVEPPADENTEQTTASPDDPAMPPASFGMLMSSLATEALVAMGSIPNPASNEVVVRRNLAKYLIDTLEMLKEKTTGNLTPEENAALDDVLHQLRMAFVSGG